MRWTVFGGAQTAVQLNFVENLQNNQTESFLNAAKWAGP